MTISMTPPPIQHKSPPWLRGLQVQVRVVHALMIRIVLARFGHENLGFFWIICEPLILTCGIMFVWSVMKMGHGSEVGVVPFALTGYMFITLWRHVVMRAQKIMQGNIALRFHRQVDYVDVMLANTLIETAAIFTAFIVALTPLWLLGWSSGIRDPLVLVGGFVLTAWFSFSFGLVLAAVSEISEAVHHIIPALMYLTLPLTGTFFMVDWLPEKTQAIVLWSPLVNCVEMIRSGMFPLDAPTHWSAGYLVVCCVVLTGIGLPLCVYMGRHVQTS